MRTYILTKPRLKPIATARHAEDAKCPDGGWKPLTKGEKAALSILARKAAVVQGVSLKKLDLDAWRQQISVKACGRRISEAVHDDWADIKSAFEDLAGQPEKAFSTQLRSGDNKRRVAMHKLTEALTKKNLNPSYAASICRAQFKVNLEEASAKQLWCLFYTINGRKAK
ncbi:MAG: hypothetical protein ABIS50_15300 [Luteolibacter sp.]|uniref:hypothetical protein n=1 Tax=Luteolibacter sp. TaxID=1962973 RepID=UPI0032657718